VWQDANTGETIEVTNPATGDVIGTIAWAAKVLASPSKNYFMSDT